MSLIRNGLALAFIASTVAACTVTTTRTRYEAREHCRTVEVHGRRDVERCYTRCHDGLCRTHCQEQERISRERRCWVD